MSNAYDFDISLTYRHTEKDDKFSDIARAELHNLSKYHANIIDGSIIVNRENSTCDIEITIRVPGRVFHAAATDHDPIKAFDIALEKTKIQLKREHDKMVDHHSIPTSEAIERLNGQPEEESE